MLMLRTAIYWEFVLFVGGLLGIIIYQLLTGRINTQNLFCGTKRNGEKYFSPERVQLLVFTIGAALNYLHSVILNRHTGEFPSFGTGMLQLLGYSNAVYLAGKGVMTLKVPSQGNSSNSKGS